MWWLINSQLNGKEIKFNAVFLLLVSDQICKILLEMLGLSILFT